MAELFGGAAIGAVFSELLKVVVDQATQIAEFETQVNRLKTTLTSILPVLFHITEMEKVLDRPEEETKTFIGSLNDGRELVLKCSRIKFWDVKRKLIYSKKLISLDKEIIRFFNIKAQADILSTVTENSIKLDQVLAAVTSRADGFSGWCSVPGLSDHIIGFDGHLSELKRRLIKDETRVLVVSAPGGCGKTTLAKMLCHDKDIKGIYVQNIIYVTVSRESSLKDIATKLFKHYGQNDIVFKTEEEAKNQIEILMQKETGSDKMLLVLDDVWSESESLVQNLMFQIPRYKILVTSRFTFKRFNSTYQLSLLNDKFAKTLLCDSAFPDGNPVNVPDALVNEMVKFCKGFPLALTVVGASLCGQDVLMWKTTLNKRSQGKSILGIDPSLLLCLQTSIDALDQLPLLPLAKECFFDLGSFPEDERIADTVLLDMWVELYKLNDNSMDANEYLLELSLRNLVTLVQIRKYIGELEGYDNGYYITQHDMLRELAIHMSGQEPEKERNRLFMEIHGNKFPPWWVEQTEQPLEARILSISTDEAFRSDLYDKYDLNAPNVEVLILNIRSNDYALPHFIKRMSQLKVLIVTGYGVNPTQLENLSFLGSLSNLKIIRFEHVSISLSIQIFFELQNLKKLAFVTCKIGNASGVATYKLEGATALPNLWFTTGSHMVLALICLIVAYLVRPVIKFGLRHLCNASGVTTYKLEWATALPNFWFTTGSQMVLALICLIVAYLVRPVIKFGLRHLCRSFFGPPKHEFLATPPGNALQNGGITKAPYMLSNLTDIEINGCYDLKELPAELCSLLRLQKLTINNCNKMDALPRELGSLSNLQTLRLHGCTKLQELPDTIGSLHNLNFFDISDCLNIKELPEHIGELSGLRVLNMSGCRGIQELPESVKKLSQLDVICDDETSYMWKCFGSDDLYNVKINVVEEDRSGIFSNITR